MADAPSVATSLNPAASESLDAFANGVTFSGIYNAPSGDTGALASVILKQINVTTSTTYYWNGTALQSGSVSITPSTGAGASNGEQFTVVVPAGILVDGDTWEYAFETIESFAGLNSGFNALTTFSATAKPLLPSTRLPQRW